MVKSKRKHITDTVKLKCDCEDFKYRRHKFNKSDERRICKHLAEILGVEVVPVNKEVHSCTDKHWSEKKRHLRSDAEKIVTVLNRMLNREAGISRFEICGSYRRQKETIGDIDIIMSTVNDDWTYNTLILQPIIEIAEKVMTSGKQKSSILFGGIQVDFRFVKKEFFVFQLAHATGSADENKRLRSIAKQKGMKLNEYGLFKNNIPVKGIKSEKDIYKNLGIPYVKPEDR
ncbi:MAG: hypothetical protein WC343_05660 [Bacilli bacterium]|jgi:DNA polymerase (family 10)